MSETPGMDDKKKFRRLSIANVAAATFLALIILAVFIFVMNSTPPRHGIPTRTLNTACALESAVNYFQTEYGAIPDVVRHATTDSPEGLKLLTILLGRERQTGKHQNTHDIKFLNVVEGTNRKNGLIYSKFETEVEGLFDPWGNPYTVELDTKNEGRLHFTLGNKNIDLKGRRVAAYSPGPDGKLGTKDDVLTW